MAVLSGNSSGILYENETSQTLIVTVGARAFSTSTVRFSATAGSSTEVTVEPNGLELRTYQLGPGQRIQMDTGGSAANVVLEINGVVSGD